MAPESVAASDTAGICVRALAPIPMARAVVSIDLLAFFMIKENGESSLLF